jgi:hypothetical protein
MTTATPPSGSVDESIAFRQGVSVVTIKDQLTGMLPKFSAGTRSRIVIDGNAPESDVYFDDSMMGMGPGTIVPEPAAIFPVFSYDHDFDEFVELYDIEDPGVMKLEVTGSYEGEFDATFRIQIADPDDDDVFTISQPVFTPTSGSLGLNDLNVILEDVTETDAEGEERVLIASGSYDSEQGIAIYRVEIATAHEGSADTIKWYKNDELLTTNPDGDVITAVSGNVLEDGDNRIVIQFDYDGYDDEHYGEKQKHTVGDYWHIVAGTQQIRWAQGDFDDSLGITLTPIEGTERNIGTPTGILQTDYQHLADGVYIKLPAQVGYADGSDPNEEAPIWEFKVRSLKPEAAITAMQEAAGKIQIYPDHRAEQRDFGQPKFHNDFDVMTQWQQQVATVEVLTLDEIGQQNPSWVFSDPDADPLVIDVAVPPRTSKYNTQLYDSELENKKNYSLDQANALDEANGLDISLTPDPMDRGWRESTSSDDGSVGPYFTIYDLHEKEKKDRKNYFWFNYGNTTTRNLAKYDDKDPRPILSTGLPIDVSARELSEIEFSGNDVETQDALYEIYNVDALTVIESPTTGQSYWSNDGGITMTDAITAHPAGFPTSETSSGNILWSLTGSEAGTYTTPENAGWDPDIDEDDPLTAKMSEDINGAILVDSGGVPTPLDVNDWMIHHGYLEASIDELTWMDREGYIPYEDVLHDKWFTMYDFDFRCFFIRFNVVDINDGSWNPDYDAATDTFNPASAVYRNPPPLITPRPLDDSGNVKSKSPPSAVYVHINRYDKAKDITQKIIERLNRNVPLAMQAPTHPFYQGARANDDFEAVLDDNDNFIVQVNLRKPGKVQESEGSTDLPDDFQCWLRTHGSSGYTQRVLDDDDLTTFYVGNFILLYNPTDYWYPALDLTNGQDHSHLGFTVDAANQLWSNDDGLTTVATADLDPADFGDGMAPLQPVEIWLGGYKPYVGVSSSTPHLVWYNVSGISKIPTKAASSGTQDVHELWSYDIPDAYGPLIEEAVEYGHVLEVKCFPQSIDRTMAYLTNRELQRSDQFIIPFISSTPANQNIIRIQQRDPGPISTPSELENICPHEGNSPVRVADLRPGVELTQRDRDYTCDSIVFAVDDHPRMTQRFSAEKRIVYNYGTYDINCVAEEKSGKLFDFSEQVWDDPDSDVSVGVGQIRKGGTSDLSNYEPVVVDKWSDVPQKEISGEFIWKRLESSIEEFTAASVGYDVVTSMYDSDNRKIWTHTDGTFHTAKSLGLEDDDLGTVDYPDYDWDADHTIYSLSETDWMTYEGYFAVPSFTHKIANAAYFYLPHPDKNFYVWFDTAQLSADPGDDGFLDAEFALDPDGVEDVNYNGGAIRVAIDSYDNAGVIAQKLVERINSDHYDVGKKHVQVGMSGDEPVFQAVTAGNVNKQFYAEISEEDSSIVRITCLDHGLINVPVFEKNALLSLPITESEDEFTITLVDDGDTDFYVDVTNTIAGTVLPPITDVVDPDADTGLTISVSEEPYTPTQPGITKVTSAFLPYEDMMSLSRGYRQVNEDGIEQCLAGPVAYIEDDIGTLIYPIIMSNVSMKDPDQYDGVLEPLEIRSRASRNSPDAYFVAHDIKGILQSDVAEDSRRRSNPITQFIDNDRTHFEPYEDGVEHMESSPAVAGFTRTPVFNGAGKNDMLVLGNYVIAAGSETETYHIRCVTGYPMNDTSTTYDKFEWSKSDGIWSDAVELSTSTTMETEVVLTFPELGGSTVSDYQFLEVPGGSTQVVIKAYGKGDINGIPEYYQIQYYDEDAAIPGWVDIEDPVTTTTVQLNNASHPDGEDARYEYPATPHWTYTITDFSAAVSSMPNFDTDKVKLRIWVSPEVTPGIGLTNSVKLSFLFTRRAARMDLDHGLYVVFNESQGHNSGDTWWFEAIAKSHEDSVGCSPLPGYLTWQESRIHPFVETTYKEEVTNDLNDPVVRSHSATGSLIFNYSGYTASILDADGLNSTWEKEYLRSLNGQAFTLEDSLGAQKRFEFDNDGELENDGEELISILRPEVYYIRFPDTDYHFQERDANGELLWEDADGLEFPASAPLGTDSAGDPRVPYTVTALFGELTLEEWVQYYDLRPHMTTTIDISTQIPTAEQYAGKYFVITDAVDEEQDHVLNTITGGRYAVWFNIVDPDDLDDSGIPVSLADAPTFSPAIGDDVVLYYDETGDGYKDAEDPTLQTDWDEASAGLDSVPGFSTTSYTTEAEWAIYYGLYSTRVVKVARWSNDTGDTIVPATPSLTGWDPDPATQTMSTNTSAQSLYTSDGGETIVPYTGAPVDEENWVLTGGYMLAELNEIQWHEYEGWKNYEKLKPQLIEVVANKDDSIKRLMSKTLRAIRRFKNPNQSKVFRCDYIKPPTYKDFYDMDPASGLPAGNWQPADYDDILYVLLEDTWFNQYSYDPESPPVKAALDAGWSRGYFTLKITSRNLGYHKVDEVDPASILGHEPGYVHPDLIELTDVRSFTLYQDPGIDVGGHKTFKQLLDSTIDTINGSGLDLHAAARYDDFKSGRSGTNQDAYKHGLISDTTFTATDGTEYTYASLFGTGPDTSGDGLVSESEWTTWKGLYKTWGDDPFDTGSVWEVTAESIDDGITLSSNGSGGTEYEVFSAPGLFENILVLYPTLAERSTYTYKQKLCGIDLIQNSPGHKGNTKVTFHYYDESFRGNIITENFTNGYDAGPYMNETVSSMNMSTSELRPHDHKSSSAGMIYNDMPCGTDSITFGGWKK